MQEGSTTSKRIEALDYLRGFFILVIIIDHMWRWPNLFQFASGRGELWVSAAEGFVIISGLLVGYVRGRKGLKKSFAEITKKLMLRGVMLYAWAIITTVLLVAATWYLTFQSNIANVPYAPYDWGDVLRDAFTLNYTHILSHFLYLYAIFLIFSPALIWLLRNKYWLESTLLSITIWYVGYMTQIEWMQWQILFYVPAVAGFYLDEIIAFFRRVPKSAIQVFVALNILSIILCLILVLPLTPGAYYNEIFLKEPFSIYRILLAFSWFVSLAWVFNSLVKILERSLGWLLLPIGTRSLTAYIAHSLPLMLICFFLPNTHDFWINTLLVAVAILGTWAILKIPHINKVIPR